MLLHDNKQHRVAYVCINIQHFAQMRTFTMGGCVTMTSKETNSSVHYKWDNGFNNNCYFCSIHILYVYIIVCLHRGSFFFFNLKWLNIGTLLNVCFGTFREHSKTKMWTFGVTFTMAHKDKYTKLEIKQWINQSCSRF